MSEMIQVRNAPDRLHRELRDRARRRGLSLTAYIEEILERELESPLAEDVFARIKDREPVDLGVSAAELIRAEREGRERQLESLSTRRSS
jgi:antitoxin FitA